MRLISRVVIVSLIARAALAAPVAFTVSFADSVRKESATGRVVVYLIKEGSSVGISSPSDGPFWYDPQPLYGVDVKDLKPGETATLDDAATAFGPKPSELKPGRYRAQAVLDVSRLDSSWKREPGNLFSDVVNIEVKPQGQQSFAIPLKRTIERRPPKLAPGQEVFEVRSKLLSDFRKTDVMLRAGVVFPREYDPARTYPAIYEVPGFGGNHLDGFHSRRRAAGTASELQRAAFYITLDPESPNGHTLFADSDVNGPCGEALVKELIPALEAKYKLIAQPSARLLRGHSSGGWSVLWLALAYPETFGACWSSSPDPVDFRRFELINIYDDPSAYADKNGNDVPSTREGGKPTLSVRGENQQEEVLGENNTSGQQWDSWQAVFGSRRADGWPASLFDARTGKLDHAEAQHYKRYDIAHRLREHPDKYGPIFLQRIRLICGDADDFYLNEAVALLKEDVDKLAIGELAEGRHGYVKMLPGLDHGSIFGSEAMRAFPQEMLDHLKRNGHAR
jgi:pimeloyl-ACP methyl ester carboxylesterase